MPLYCHLGMPKSGSKAIQSVCLSNKEIGSARYATGLLDGGWHKSFFQGEARYRIPDVRDEAAAVGDLIFSFEGGYLADDIDIAALDSVGEPIRALILLRHPVEWVSSYFNQMIKSHRAPYDRIRHFSIRAGWVTASLSMRKHVDRWTRAANLDGMSIDLYRPEDDAVVRFLDWLAVPAEARTKLNRPKARPNQAADLFSLRVLLEVKRQTPGVPADEMVRIGRVAYDVLRGRWDAPSSTVPLMLLDKAEQDEIAARYVDEYVELAREFGGSPRPYREREHELVPRDELFRPTSEERECAADILARAGRSPTTLEPA